MIIPAADARLVQTAVEVKRLIPSHLFTPFDALHVVGFDDDKAQSLDYIEKYQITEQGYNQMYGLPDYNISTKDRIERFKEFYQKAERLPNKKKKQIAKCMRLLGFTEEEARGKPMKYYQTCCRIVKDLKKGVQTVSVNSNNCNNINSNNNRHWITHVSSDYHPGRRRQCFDRFIYAAASWIQQAPISRGVHHQ